MGFVKLSDSIFGSSIMEESESTRLFWFYLQLMADADGVVDESPVALARQFNMPRDVVMDAIDALESPDPESRSECKDGRRIVRLDGRRSWGWRLANHTAYREGRSEEEK